MSLFTLRRPDVGLKSRQEKEIRRLIEQGRPVSAVRKDLDESGQTFHIAATLRKVDGKYQLLIDFYYPTGSTGETIKENGIAFSDLNQLLCYLEDVSGIQLYELKP